eukprot:TRINITY_DN22250_c0_g1_i1.p2 TRINITY_DN22250_c0_g1~~TRINITY_DN22250_c0_g1_i1.p2  ORF type:complete len:224 (+),score=46.48 TRINITY_DN22250_c0_g1_i1:128-799(+)
MAHAYPYVDPRQPRAVTMPGGDAAGYAYPEQPAGYAASPHPANPSPQPVPAQYQPGYPGGHGDPYFGDPTYGAGYGEEQGHLFPRTPLPRNKVNEVAALERDCGPTAEGYDPADFGCDDARIGQNPNAFRPPRQPDYGAARFHPTRSGAPLYIPASNIQLDHHFMGVVSPTQTVSPIRERLSLDRPLRPAADVQYEYDTRSAGSPYRAGGPHRFIVPRNEIPH